MVDRKIRWNRFTDTGEQERMRYTYYFAVLNEPREIIRIRERIVNNILHVDEVMELDYFKIKGSNGLGCEIFSFSTDSPNLPDFSRIYQGDVRQDRDLYERKMGNWDAYFEKLLED